MPTTTLTAHLSTAELGQRYRAARCPIERSHLQIVWLLSQGRSEREVAAVTGYGQRWIAAIVQRYNAEGTGGLGDRRATNTGAQPLLNEEDTTALRDALGKPPPEGGLWTGPKVATWMSQRLGRKVWPQRGWDYLQKLEHRLQMPRPKHAKAASAEEQDAFKKSGAAGRGTPCREPGPPGRGLGVRRASGRAEADHPPALASLGLASLTGPDRARCARWAPIGQRPIALGQHRFEWLYVYGFVHPSTGEVVWFLGNGVSTALFSAVLAAFATAVGAGPDKLVVLVLDNAGWHSSDKLVVPDGLRLVFLPPYSPELQPAERLWPLTNEAVANQSFATLKELDEAVGKRCCTLAGLPDLLKGHTNYSWWPKPPQVTLALN